MDINLINKQLESLAEIANNYVSLLANASALLNENMADINWVGFYLVKDNYLLLGPFQGKSACVRIDKGKGVCGSAYEKDEIILVDNVHEFPGHIACDEASKSEIVIPIHNDNKVVGVLDIDSPIYNRFSNMDKDDLLSFVLCLEKLIIWD